MENTKKRYSITIELDNDGNVEITSSDSKKLSSFIIKGNFTLLDSEELFYNNLTKHIKTSSLSLVASGDLANFTISGNSGAGK